MRTLEEKLKFYKKQKIKEISLPMEMLKESLKNTPIELFLDLNEQDNNDYYCISNIVSYSINVPFKISLYDKYELEENNKLIHKIVFENGKVFEIPFSYTELFQYNKLESLWSRDLFPNLIIGDIYITLSPICYLTTNFNNLLNSGVYAMSWDKKVPEGTALIVYEKKEIDDLYFTKVLYDGQMFWCFGILASEDFCKSFNPHYI